MKSPLMIADRLVDKDGYLSTSWQMTFDQLLGQLNQNFGESGCVIPSLSSDPDSVIPSTTGGQIGLIEDKAKNGTLIYDSFTNELKLKKPGGFVVII